MRRSRLVAEARFVFIEAAQRIRCYSCVKRAIGAAENIDMPIAFQFRRFIVGF